MSRKFKKLTPKQKRLVWRQPENWTEVAGSSSLPAHLTGGRVPVLRFDEDWSQDPRASLMVNEEES
jgi:hypothetical protein